MRKFLPVALLVLAATSSVHAQQAGPWAQKIFVGVTNHDFGTCPHGAHLKHRIPMKNIYAVPLEITEIRTSCGCLTWTPSSKVLKPKEEGYIDIVMDASKFKGPKTVSLFISVGPKYVSTAVIQFTANARTDVVFNPGEINFGVVQAGDTQLRIMDVEYAGVMDWRILEVVKTKAAPFAVTATETFRQAKGLLKTGKVGYQLQVTLNPDAPPGSFREELLLKTNDPASPVLTVFIEGNVQAALAVTPDQVKFEKVKVGQKVTQKVVVKGKQPFRILSVSGGGEGIQADLPTTAATFHVVHIHFQPQQAGDVNRKLTLHTDLGKGTELAITLQANVAP
jgi:hypothetical protein